MKRLHDPSAHGEGRPFGRGEASRLRLRKTRLVGEGVVHESDQAHPASVAVQLVREPTGGQAVHHDQLVVADPPQRRVHAPPRHIVSRGKGSVELVDDDVPASGPQLGHHAGVVEVPAGALIQGPRDHEVDAPRGHTAPA